MKPLKSHSLCPTFSLHGSITPAATVCESFSFWLDFIQNRANRNKSEQKSQNVCSKVWKKVTSLNAFSRNTSSSRGNSFCCRLKVISYLFYSLAQMYKQLKSCCCCFKPLNSLPVPAVSASFPRNLWPTTSTYWWTGWAPASHQCSSA